MSIERAVIDAMIAEKQEYAQELLDIIQKLDVNKPESRGVIENLGQVRMGIQYEILTLKEVIRRADGYE